MNVCIPPGDHAGLNHRSLTQGKGTHPLLNGVKRVVITDFAQPKITEINGRVRIEVEGVTGTFEGKAESTGQTIIVRLQF